MFRMRRVESAEEVKWFYVANRNPADDQIPDLRSGRTNCDMIVAKTFTPRKAD